ncbi:hypothetical protein AB6D11_18650 [Vibrio splendidus]
MLNDSEIVRLHHALLTRDVDISMETLRDSLNTLNADSASHLELAQKTQWGTMAVNLPHVAVEADSPPSRPIELYFQDEDDSVFDVEVTLDTIMKHGHSLKATVGMELCAMINEAANGWSVASIFGEVLATTSEQALYFATYPNAPCRVFVQTAYYDDQARGFVVTYDGTHLLFHEENHFVETAQSCVIEGGEFGSPQEFKNNINHVCQVFSEVLTPYVCIGDILEPTVKSTGDASLAKRTLPKQVGLALCDEGSYWTFSRQLKTYTGQVITSSEMLRHYVQTCPNFVLLANQPDGPDRVIYEHMGTLLVQTIGINSEANVISDLGDALQ